jgi:hypothetical protein
MFNVKKPLMLSVYNKCECVQEFATTVVRNFSQERKKEREGWVRLNVNVAEFGLITAWALI